MISNAFNRNIRWKAKMFNHRKLLGYRAICNLSPILFVGCGTPNSTTPQNTDPITNRIALFPDDVDPANAKLAFVTNELLIRPFPGADSTQLQALYVSLGAVLASELPEIDLHVLRIDSGDWQSIAETLAEHELIESVHKNYFLHAQLTPNDPSFVEQLHLPQINAPPAWDLTTSDSAILIAIVDTGIDEDHPDLSGKIRDGWNVYDNNSQFDDLVGHGTQAAGCAAAISNNATGVTGVAWNSDLLAVRATDAAGQSTSRHLAAGILWAVGKGADVINVSFAPLWSNVVVQAAATSAFNRGSLVVISAGNGGGLSTSTGYAEALFVGAVTSSSSIASFSDRGPFVDIAAPGTAIRTTAVGGTYNLANGTSFASPLVAGVAALAWSINPQLPAYIIRDALTESAFDLGTAGKDGTFGAGLVNARAAVEAVQQAGNASDNAAPTLTLGSPRNQSTLTGRARVTATATDANGVAQVALLLDGRPVATDTLAPFEFVLDTSLYSAGTHQLSVVGTDSSGNDSAPKSVTVTISGGASESNGVSFRSPTAGTSVTGNVTINASVTASAGLASVEWLVNGESVLVNAVTGTSTGVSYVWRTSGLPRGPHTITLVAIDNRGVERSASLNLTLR